MICAQISFARTFQLANNVRLLNTAFAQKKESSRDRIWSRWMIQSKDDGMVRLKAQTLPPHRFEDCVQLMLKHYLKDDTSTTMHKDDMTGANDKSAAVPNCKQYLTALLSQPTTHTHVYLVDDDTADPEIVGFSSMMLISEDDDLPITLEVERETKEMKKYAEIYDALTNLFPAREVLKRYQVDCYYQDIGLAFTPTYKSLGIAKYDASVRRMVCQAHGVPVTTAWCTLPTSRSACEADDWEVVFDISLEELATYLGVRLEGAPHRCTLMATKTM